ncbi:MAG: hypothetical protein KDA51_04920 [Planctomycetales bacterium]|nr:hypothetical protein [Planctomycetales bacterium]
MMATYKVGISTLALAGKLPQGDPRWAALNDSFENRELEAIEFIDAIYQGHSYTAWFNGRRKADNFQCAQHIAVDLDTKDERSTLNTVERNYFFRMYGSIIHETPSHTDDAPKCRAIFLLDNPIQTAAGYRMALETVYQFFDGADIACIDPARFFYGNAILQHRPQGIYFTDNVLPLAELRRYARQMLLVQKQQMEAEQRRHQQQQRTATQPRQGDDPYSLLDHAVNKVATTGEGGRNHQLNASAYRVGRLVASGALDESTAVSQLESAARSI